MRLIIDVFLRDLYVFFFLISVICVDFSVFHVAYNYASVLVTPITTLLKVHKKAFKI